MPWKLRVVYGSGETTDVLSPDSPAYIIIILYIIILQGDVAGDFLLWRRSLHVLFLSLSLCAHPSFSVAGITGGTSRSEAINAGKFCRHWRRLTKL